MRGCLSDTQTIRHSVALRLTEDVSEIYVERRIRKLKKPCRDYEALFPLFFPSQVLRYSCQGQ